MSSNDTKHVQTELDQDEYEQFREFANERGLSLREAGHEALLDWVRNQRRADPNDPAFTVLDDLDAESSRDGEGGDRRLPGHGDVPPGRGETDAREADDLVDEWCGDDADLTLADDPTEHR